MSGITLGKKKQIFMIGYKIANLLIIGVCFIDRVNKNKSLRLKNSHLHLPLLVIFA